MDGLGEGRRDSRLTLLVMLQVVFLLASVVLMPGLAVAETEPQTADPAAMEPADAHSGQALPSAGEETSQRNSTTEAATQPPAASELGDSVGPAQPEAGELAPKGPAHEDGAERNRGNSTESTPKTEPAPALTIHLHPGKIQLYPGGKATVSAWTCPANDRSPFGKDKTPGTGDDDCAAALVEWSLAHSARAHLSSSVGYKTRVTLDRAKRTKLVARLAGMERRAKVLVRGTPAAIRPEATKVDKATAPAIEPKSVEGVETPSAAEANETTAPTEPPAEPSETRAEPTDAEPSESPAEAFAESVPPGPDDVASEPTAEPTKAPAGPTEPPAEVENRQADLLGAAPSGADGVAASRDFVPAASAFSVTPASQSVSSGSTNDFAWTFTALNAANVNATAFTIPSAWTDPSASAGPGQVTVTAGTCAASLLSVVGDVVTIDQGPGSNRCGNGQTFTVRYLGATAPALAPTRS